MVATNIPGSFGTGRNRLYSGSYDVTGFTEKQSRGRRIKDDHHLKPFRCSLIQVFNFITLTEQQTKTMGSFTVN